MQLMLVVTYQHHIIHIAEVIIRLQYLLDVSVKKGKHDVDPELAQEIAYRQTLASLVEVQHIEQRKHLLALAVLPVYLGQQLVIHGRVAFPYVHL